MNEYMTKDEERLEDVFALYTYILNFSALQFMLDDVQKAKLASFLRGCKDPTDKPLCVFMDAAIEYMRTVED